MAAHIPDVSFAWGGLGSPFDAHLQMWSPRSAREQVKDERCRLAAGGEQGSFTNSKNKFENFDESIHIVIGTIVP